MGKEKKTESRKYNARTPKEIALQKANKCVENMTKAIDQLGDLRVRINSLPGEDFPAMAKSFNGFIDSLPDFTSQRFAETERPPTPEQVEADKKSFEDYMISDAQESKGE